MKPSDLMDTGVNVCGAISVEFSTEGESTSVLVHGESNLERRVVLGQRAQELETWFACVEVNAWTYVNASSEIRPDKIFLVSPEYAICHQERGSSSSEIYVEANVELPAVVQGNILYGTRWGRVSASTGFQILAAGSSDINLHSIFLKVVESRPTTRIRRASRFQRLHQMHRCTHPFVYRIKLAETSSNQPKTPAKSRT